MSNNGFIRTITDGTHEIKVKASGETLYVYEGFFGTDLYDDIMQFFNNNTSEEMLTKVLSIGNLENAKKLKPEQTAEIMKGAKHFKFGGKFMRNFLVALVGTAQPEAASPREIARTIPPHFFANPAILTELVEFLTMFIEPPQNTPLPSTRGSV